jgi:hypothetical protein
VIRRSPCELYIKFLVVHPHGFDTRGIRDKLREMGLDCLSEDYIDRLRARLDPPSPFRPLEISHRASQRFLMKHKLLGFFFPDEASKVAHDLVKSPRAKETIETMTLSNEPPALVAHMVRATGNPCTLESLRRYCTYYWDLSLVDSVEIRALLRMRWEYLSHPDTGTEVKPESRLQFYALKNASYKDPRRLVTEMPITPLAGLLNRMRMGFMPSQVDLGRLANATRIAATLRAYDAVMSGAPQAAMQARDFAVTARVMTELINEIGSPDAELQKELQQLALRTDDTRPPTIHELSDGLHTVELLPSPAQVEVIDAEPPEQG